MPQFSQDAKRVPLTIADNQYEVPELFAEGHTLKSGEAKALNQLLRENVRNNLASRLKADKDGNIQGLSQADVDAYVTEYEFGAGRGPGNGEARLSPVERKARQIAREKVQAALKARGMKIDLKTEDGKAQMEALISKAAAKPEIIKEAEKQLRAVEKLALEDLDLGDAQAEAA